MDHSHNEMSSSQSKEQPLVSGQQLLPKDVLSKIGSVRGDRDTHGQHGEHDNQNHGLHSDTTAHGITGQSEGLNRGLNPETTTHGSQKAHFVEGAALGAGGAGLAEHEHNKHENTGLNTQNPGYSQHTTAGQPLTGYPETTTHDSQKTHLAEGAVLGAGGAGIAEHAHNKHEYSGLATQNPEYSQHPTTGQSQIGHPESTTHGSQKAHLTEGAALGAGGAGLAKHEHNKHEKTGLATHNAEHDQHAIAGAINDNLHSSTAGQPEFHEGSEMSSHHFLRDARIGGSSGVADTNYEQQRHLYTEHPVSQPQSVSGHTGDHYGQDAALGAGGVTAAHQDSQAHTKSDERAHEPVTQHDDHHYGRDAAVGATGVAATAAVAEHEHGKHEEKSDQNKKDAYDFESLPGPAPKTAGPHKKDWLNRLDPRVDAYPSRDPEETHSDHHAKEAAGATAVGGAGAYEAEKHADHKNDTVATAGHSKKEQKKLTKEPKKSHDRKDSKISPSESDSASEKHYGRDAAIIGGAGAAGGTAYEAEKHHEQKEGKELSKHDRVEEKHATGVTGTQPHGSTVANKLDPRIDNEVLQQNRENQFGRDAAVVGGATVIGAGAYEANQHHKEGKNQPLPDRVLEKHATGTTGIEPHSSNLMNKVDPRVDNKVLQQQQQQQQQQPSQDHHYGRDAAVIGGAGAAGETAHETEQKKLSLKELKKLPMEERAAIADEYHRTHGQTTSKGETIAPIGRSRANSNAIAPTAQPTHLTSDNSGFTAPGDSNTSRQFDQAPLDPAHQQQLHQDTHYGRDAALAGGAGAAAYEADKHFKNRDGKDANVEKGVASNTIGGTTEPHSTTGNKLVHSTDRDATVGGQNLDKDKDHHYGRDAALLGGTGAAAYEADKHLRDRDGKDTNIEKGTTTNTVGGTTQTHPSTVGESFGSRTGQDAVIRDQNLEKDKDHHYGRDAAIVGGVGAAAYEANKHHQKEKEEKEALEAQKQKEKEQQAALEQKQKQEREQKKALEAQQKKLKEEQIALEAEMAKKAKADQKKLEEEQHHKEKEHQKAIAAQEKEQKKLEKSQKKDDPEEKEKKGGILGFLHRDKSKKEAKEDEQLHHSKEEFSLGRDATIATAAGAAGVAGYEYNQHRNEKAAEKQSTEPTPVARKQTIEPTSIGEKRPGITGTQELGSGIGSVAQPGTAVTTGPGVSAPVGQSQDHHFARDAAIAGGTAVATGHGIHEHEKNKTAADKPSDVVATGSGLNQKSTAGTASNPTIGQTQDHHYGRDATVAGGTAAATGLGAHEHQKNKGLTDNPSDGLAISPVPTGSVPHEKSLAGTSSNPSIEQSHDHHYGRDATLASGVVAATGYGIHEHEKNKGLAEKPSDNRAASLAPNEKSTIGIAPDPTIGQTQDHQYGRDAAIASGTAAAGLGAHEHEKNRSAASNPSGGLTTGYVPTDRSATSAISDPIAQPTALSTSTTTHPEKSEGHHYGRDAALIGGAGALGAGAYQHQKAKEKPDVLRHDSETLEKLEGTAPDYSEAYGTQPRTVASPHRLEPQVASTETGYRDPALAAAAKAMGGTTSGNTLGRTTTTGASGLSEPTSSRVDSKLDPSTRQDQGQDFARDAALAATGTGAVLAGNTYEDHKHAASDTSPHIPGSYPQEDEVSEIATQPQAGAPASTNTEPLTKGTESVEHSPYYSSGIGPDGKIYNTVIGTGSGAATSLGNEKGTEAERTEEPGTTVVSHLTGLGETLSELSGKVYNTIVGHGSNSGSGLEEKHIGAERTVGSTLDGEYISGPSATQGSYSLSSADKDHTETHLPRRVDAVDDLRDLKESDATHLGAEGATRPIV